MDRKWRIVAAAVVAVGLTAGISGANLTGARVDAERDVADANDMEAIAQKLVTETAGVREGEFVLVQGSPRDLELLENLAVNVRKVGAFPFVLLDTDRMERRMFDDVPAEYDAQPRTAALELADLVDVVILLDTNEDPAVLAGVPEERIIASGQADREVFAKYREKGARTVAVGNGIYPTSANAKIYGMERQALADLFWSGVGADYQEVERRGEAVRKIFESGSEVRLTNPNGTDLSFRIESRPVFVSDGTISAEDARRGGAATQVWLPAGEVFVTPVAGSARGKLVVDWDNFQGKEIDDLSVSFEGGKVTSITAKSGLEPWKAFYDVGTRGRDEFAYFDIGLNPAVRPPANSRLRAYMPEGMVTVGIGNNEWAGGENTSSVGSAWFLPGSTVEVDGKVVVEDGELRI